MTEKKSCNSPVSATRRSILAYLPGIRSAALLREQIVFCFFVFLSRSFW